MKLLQLLYLMMNLLMQQRFSAAVESDFIIVHSFHDPHTVSSYRVARFSARFIDLVNQSETRLRRAQAESEEKRSFVAQKTVELDNGGLIFIIFMLK